jgi:hypothetical protein
MESHLVESFSIFEVFPRNAKFPTFCGVSQPGPGIGSMSFRHWLLARLSNSWSDSKIIPANMTKIFRRIDKIFFLVRS